MEDIDLNKWKPNKLPKKDCTFQGVINCCNRVCCNTIGTDVSPEFCFYCRYYSKTIKMEPMIFAQKFNDFLYKLEEKHKKGE